MGTIKHTPAPWQVIRAVNSMGATTPIIERIENTIKKATE